jgi:hypothetical protein
MRVPHHFAAVADRLLGDVDVEQGRMLHAPGLKVRGRFFAFTTKEELVVKLPAARVNELIAGGAGRPCDPRKGRPMREWVRLTPADETACATYMVEARHFVATKSR